MGAERLSCRGAAQEPCSLNDSRVRSISQGGAPLLQRTPPADDDAKSDPSKDPAMQHAVSALRSYMQELSELQVPRWQLQALADSDTLGAYSRVITAAHGAREAGQRWLHLGVGTGTLLMKTLSLVGKLCAAPRVLVYGVWPEYWLGGTGWMITWMISRPRVASCL